MNYRFIVRNTASDLWQMMMYGIYGALPGTINIVFTVSMVLLSIRFFAGASILLKCLLIVAVSLFTIIQPLILYRRAVKLAKANPGEVELLFDDNGMHIRMGDQREDINWSGVRGITRKPTLLILYSSKQHGFVLSNRVLGPQREPFYAEVVARINK